MSTLSKNTPLSQEIPDQWLDKTLRPSEWDEYIGQENVKNNLRILIGAAQERGHAPEHLLLYGPPGLGKTTLAHLIATDLGATMKITSGPAIERVGDLAAILTNLGKNDILFVDEIHRFNKAQQDGFLPYVEDGTIILVGATTENPSFELNAALLSRCQVFVLNRLDDEALEKLLQKAEEKIERRNDTKFLEKIFRIAKERFGFMGQFLNVAPKMKEGHRLRVCAPAEVPPSTHSQDTNGEPRPYWARLR